MSSEKDKRRRRHDFNDETGEVEESSRRPKVDPDERDEYLEWRQEHGGRGRKRKDKAGGRHLRKRDEDEP